MSKTYSVSRNSSVGFNSIIGSKNNKNITKPKTTGTNNTPKKANSDIKTETNNSQSISSSFSSLIFIEKGNSEVQEVISIATTYTSNILFGDEISSEEAKETANKIGKVEESIIDVNKTLNNIKNKVLGESSLKEIIYEGASYLDSKFKVEHDRSNASNSSSDLFMNDNISKEDKQKVNEKRQEMENSFTEFRNLESSVLPDMIEYMDESLKTLDESTKELLESPLQKLKETINSLNSES